MSPSAASAKALPQPRWRVIAAGLDGGRWFDDGPAVGTGGIPNTPVARQSASLRR
jgi:hypothetical protein